MRPGAKVRYEWPNLHIFESHKTNKEKDHNKETMLLAESIKAKRLLDQQTSSHGLASAVKETARFSFNLPGLKALPASIVNIIARYIR